MNDVIGRVFDFGDRVHPASRELYTTLAVEGQRPKVLLIGCADSRVVPELVLQADPGDVFVCRNAGNIVPPYGIQNGGVVGTIEYAVAAVGVTDIVVCGHFDCGAMKALLNPSMTEDLPNVRNWLQHGQAARRVVNTCYDDLTGSDALRAAALENVVVQLRHLRTHPTVAAGIANGSLTLHGWYVDFHEGTVLALDGDTGRFVPVQKDRALPVALAAAPRRAAAREAVEAAA